MVKTNITKRKKYSKKRVTRKKGQSGGTIYDKISTIMKRIVDNPTFKAEIKETILKVGKQLKEETIEAIEVTLGGPGAVVKKKPNTFLEEVATQIKTRLQKKVVKSILEEIHENIKGEVVYSPRSPIKNKSVMLKFRGKKSSTPENFWSSEEIKNILKNIRDKKNIDDKKISAHEVEEFLEEFFEKNIKVNVKKRHIDSSDNYSRGKKPKHANTSPYGIKPHIIKVEPFDFGKHPSNHGTLKFNFAKKKEGVFVFGKQASPSVASKTDTVVASSRATLAQPKP